MAFRFYLVPTMGAGTFADPRGPRYFINNAVAGPWSAMDYGLEPWMIVGANLSATDEANLIGQPDVFALPVNLDQTLTAEQVATVQAKLDAINMPSAWVSTTNTWRQVAKAVMGVMAFMQRVSVGYQAALFSGSVSLGTTYSQLPLAVRNELQAAANSFNLDTSGMTGATTIRQMLRQVGQQLETAAYTFTGLTL